VHNGSHTCFTAAVSQRLSQLCAEKPPDKLADARATVRLVKQHEKRNGGLLWSIVGARLQAWIQYTVQKDSN
jgi:hypothetical protein